MMYSIKMRSAKGGPHEEGGKHISGAERILREDEIEEELINVYRRAITHEKGKPDFINLKIEVHMVQESFLYVLLKMMRSCIIILLPRLNGG